MTNPNSIPLPSSPVQVSVIVVNWNRRDLLRRCLESLALQEDAVFETIVVDNGSNDGSLEMLEREFRGHPRLRLQVVENRENMGFCAANNQGFKAAGGEYFALLNNDAEADPGWLKGLLSVFKGRPDCGMAASKILVWEDPGRIDKVGHLIYLDGQNRGQGSGEIDRGQYERVKEALWPDGCAAMYRRETIEETGGFDEDFFAYADDADLGLRARMAGWLCYYAPTAVVRHHRGETLGLLSSRRLELIERNRVLLAVKLFPWSLLLLNPYYYFLRLAAGAIAGFRGRGEAAKFAGVGGKLRIAGALLRADWQALQMIPATLRKRKGVLKRLNPRQVKRLILQYRISLRQLAEEAI